MTGRDLIFLIILGAIISYLVWYGTQKDQAESQGKKAPPLIPLDKLNMSVMMRSNDLWYGFAIDQYCFSRLQQMVAQRLSIEVGQYFHFANNLHLYDDRL